MLSWRPWTTIMLGSILFVAECMQLVLSRLTATDFQQGDLRADSSICRSKSIYSRVSGLLRNIQLLLDAPTREDISRLTFRPIHSLVLEPKWLRNPKALCSREKSSGYCACRSAAPIPPFFFVLGSKKKEKETQSNVSLHRLREERN